MRSIGAVAPNLFIVGAPKCGTSSLHQYLRGHPEAFLPERKDIPFFGSDLVFSAPGVPRSTDEYLAQFTPAVGRTVVGDSCTAYMLSEHAAQEIADAFPSARIVITLRDPVDLIQSLHAHNIWMAEEDLQDPRAALQAEPDRRAGRRIPSSCRFPRGLLYRDAGRLGDQTQRYTRAFLREQMHFVRYDDIRENPHEVVRRVLRFLELPEPDSLELPRVNSRRAPRSVRAQGLIQHPPKWLDRAGEMLLPRSLHGRFMGVASALNRAEPSSKPLPEDLRHELDCELRPQVDELERLLGWDLRGWCSSASTSVGRFPAGTTSAPTA